MIHTKQWRDIEAQPVSRLPINSRTNHETVVRRAAAELIAKAPKLAFNSNLQVFRRDGSSSDRLNIFRLNIFLIRRRRRRVKEMNRSDHTLSNAPLAAAIASRFLFKKRV